MGLLRQRTVKRALASSYRPLGRQLHRWLSASLTAAMMAISTVVVAAELPQQSPSASQLFPRSARLLLSQRRIRRRDIWQEVQKRLPELPLENQYVSKGTGDISESNTLVRRMIEYHNFRKGRSPRSRFDWKLTLADYLGRHEVMLTESYPGARTLRTNPLASDRAAVQSLSREQRQQLVNTLVSLYDPSIPAAFFSPLSPSEPLSKPSSEPPLGQPAATPPEAVNTSPISPTPPPISEPGAADLLRPRR